MKSKLYSLLEQGILKKPRKVLVTYRSLIEPVNADTTIGQFTLYGVISNDDPPIALSDTINLYPSTDADHPYRTITVDITPVKEVTSVFFTLINPDNDFNLNCIINHIELVTEQGNIPIGLGILEPEALAATLITATGFTANWTEIEEATGYKVDISTDIEFGSFVGSYENYDIPSGSTVSLVVTGLADYTCYFYRIRSYNTTFTSMNSNIIHVQYAINLAYTTTYRAVGTYTKATLFTGDGLHSLTSNADSNIWLWDMHNHPMPTQWTICFWHKRATELPYDDKYLDLDGAGLDMQLYINTSEKIVVRYGGDVSVGSVLSDNTYHHIAVALDSIGLTKKIYYDGVLISSTSISAPVTTDVTTAAFFICGSGAGIDRYCKDFRIYNNILSVTNVGLVMTDTYPFTLNKIVHIKGDDSPNDPDIQSGYVLVKGYRGIST